MADKTPKFKVDMEGVWYCAPTEPRRLVAPYIRKTASLISRGTWQTIVEYRDEDNKLASLTTLRSDLSKINVIRDLLVNRGFKWPEIKSEEEALLFQYLRREPKRKIALVEKTGWFQESTFVFPDAAIGPEANNVRYRMLGEPELAPDGNLRIWTKTISGIVPYSNSAMLALGTAFGAPFHQPLRIESGGFNLFGAAGKGKTSECVAAQSVFSKSGREDVLTWDITETALDELRCERSDMLVYLDDMGRAGKSDDRRIEKISDAAFRLTTGAARRRSKIFKVDPNQPSAWLALLSTSVRSMLDISLAAGTHVFGGEEVRLIDVPASASEALGIFEKRPPFFATTGAAVYKLERVCAEHYGVAGRAYIEKIVANRPSALAFVRRMIDRFVASVGATGSSEARYAQRFGLAYAGLKLATKYGIIRLPKNAAWKAIKDCYRRARAAAPTYPQMLDKAYGQLRKSLFEMDGIIDLTRAGRATDKKKFANCKGVLLNHDLHGFIYGVKYEELVALSDSALSARQLVDCLKSRDLLAKVKGGKSTMPITIPGIGATSRQRLVCIKQRELKLQPPNTQYEE